MNWPVFLLLSYVALVLQLGLHPLLAVGSSAISPSFLLIVLVYVGMFAPPLALGWAALVLGLLVDLTTTYAVAPTGSDITILGPHALGFLAAAYALMQIRVMIFRGSPVTMAVVVFLVGLFAILVTVALLRMRGLVVADGIIGFTAMDELVFRFQQVLYTAIAALPVGFVLSKLTPLLAFHTGKMGR